MIEDLSESGPLIKAQLETTLSGLVNGVFLKSELSGIRNGNQKDRVVYILPRGLRTAASTAPHPDAIHWSLTYDVVLTIKNSRQSDSAFEEIQAAGGTIGDFGF